MIEQVTKVFEETTNAVQQSTESLSSGSANAIKYGLVAIGAGVAMVGTFGSAIGQGYATGKSVEAIARNPEALSKIRSMFILGAAVSESTAIYCLVIAFLLFFLGTN
ncbi:ATP synthase F0 subunit C [Mycoplasmopsis cricetuli]|uniref:ATP synthase F0 subunit C n=1 Tax=Mycoplasmopsis cricetuli TaxID=171283 RepID=UPI0004717F8A|nr:ATP synthase F0 subunit C [Mycoplasmopsis cricetuli]